MIRNEKKVNGMDVVIEKFTGINDFLNTYESKPIAEAYASHDVAVSLQDEEYAASERDFRNVSGYPEAVDQFRNGVNVAAMKAARTAAAIGTKKQIKKSVNGGRVSVPSYLSGSPACMRRRCNMTAKTGLDIVVDMGVPSIIDAAQVEQAGALIVKYVTEMESRYNVNLTACTSTSFNKNRNGDFKDAYIFGVKIKDAGQPFSAARVSFCLTSPAFQRVFSFLWRTRAEGVPYMYGLGWSTSNNIEQEKEVMKAVYKNAVLISALDVIRNGEKALPKMK